jgi:hypothetical protein
VVEEDSENNNVDSDSRRCWDLSQSAAKDKVDNKDQTGKSGNHK